MRGNEDKQTLGFVDSEYMTATNLLKEKFFLVTIPFNIGGDGVDGVEEYFERDFVFNNHKRMILSN
jgi:hypothetical protein